MSTVYCPNCGTRVDGRKGDYEYCKQCGEKIYIWKKVMEKPEKDKIK